MSLPPCHLLKTTHPLVPSHISLTPPSKLLFLPPSIHTCHSPSNPCCLLHLSPPLFSAWLFHFLLPPATLSTPSPSLHACPLPIAVPAAPSVPLPLRPSLLSDTLCVVDELPSVFHLPLSHLSHSLPADPPTQRVLTIHAGVYTHTHARPRAVNVLLGHSELYCRLTAGGVPGFRGQNRGE